MAKKSKNKKISKSKKQNGNQSLPVTLPFKKITTSKSIHDKTINHCFLSKTNNYIILDSVSYFSILDPINFKVLSKAVIDSKILFIIELSNNRILLANVRMIFIYEVIDNSKLNLLYHYEDKSYDKIGIIGCSEIEDENIIMISPYEFKYYKQTKKNILELYDTFDLEKLVTLQYEDYGTQFKSAFIINNNNDFLVLLTHMEIYIFNHNKKSLVKKIEIEKTRVLLKYLNLDNDYTLIYHQKKLILFNNKYLEIDTKYELAKENEEITCVEILKKNNIFAYGTNMGKIYIFNYITSEIIKEINFENQIFNVVWIKELNDNIIVNNLPKSEICFTNYENGDLLGKLSLKNSLNYRKGVYNEKMKKLLLCCANNFAILE